ncbi:MAG: prepilin-type N-terminal cleavage/methylation domain-containing protein [Desulfobulbus oligotrophicus]|jgi:prepilin-type N-terminal cleavage/methylation domain-containing protein|nr:prepilin-type N-terminal cleavage/methylation domain-containing protein [Desulfobulbus oligotrophicus]
MKGRTSSRHSAGFTLVEVLISMAIVGILVASLAGVFERSSKLYTTQNAAAALQQEVRAALDAIASEVRMATYDPRKTKKFVIKKNSATEFSFLTDWDEDGVVGQPGDSSISPPIPPSPYAKDKSIPPNPYAKDKCEARSIRFSLNSQSVQFRCGDGTPYPKDTETLIGETDHLKVTALDFSYRDKDNNSTSQRKEIRSVVITIRAQAPAGRAGMIERTYSTIVDIRNTGPNA